MQTLGVQHGQPGEQLGIEAVGLGVLGEVVPQIRRLLARHEHHDRALASEPRGERNPRVARGFHHHHHLVDTSGQPRPQCLQIGGLGPEPMPGPQDRPGLVRTCSLVRGAAGDVDADPDLHHHPFESLVVVDSSHDDEGAAPDIRYQGSPPARAGLASPGS